MKKYKVKLDLNDGSTVSSNAFQVPNKTSDLTNDSGFVGISSAEFVPIINLTVIANETGLSEKDYFEIYDGQDETGTLLFESTGSVQAGTNTVSINSGYFYICFNSNSMLALGAPTYGSSITNVTYHNDGQYGYVTGSISSSDTITVGLTYDD